MVVAATTATMTGVDGTATRKHCTGGTATTYSLASSLHRHSMSDSSASVTASSAGFNGVAAQGIVDGAVAVVGTLLDAAAATAEVGAAVSDTATVTPPNSDALLVPK